MNFCFVLDELLSASSQPGKNKRLSYYLDLYKENNIKVLLSLYKKIELPPKYKKSFHTYFYYLDEFESPPLDYLDEIVNVIIKHLKKKEPVNVNCAAGITNSGMLLVAVIMKFNEIGFKVVAQHRYGIEDPDKIHFLKLYEKYLKQKKIK